MDLKLEPVISESNIEDYDTVEYINFQNKWMEKCRTCLAKVRGMVHIFEEDPSIFDKMMYCAHIEVGKDDGLPQRICIDCAHLLENAYKFKYLAEYSDQIMRSEIMDTKNQIHTKIECAPEIYFDEEFLVNTEKYGRNLKNDSDNELSDGNLPSNKGKINQIPQLPNGNFSLFEKQDRFHFSHTKNNVSSGITDPLANDNDKNSQIRNKNILQELKVDANSIQENYAEVIEKDCLESDNQNISKGFHCTVCNKSFSGKRNLRRHKTNVHMINPQMCDECGKEFRNKTLLYTHRQHVHQTKAFKCSYCPYTYRVKATVKIHELIHTRENAKKYECNLCNKTFRFNSHLANHIRKEHKDVDIKLFQRKQQATEEIDCGEISSASIRPGETDSSKVSHESSSSTWDIRMNIEENSDNIRRKSKDFQCDECVFFTDSAFSLDNHKQIRHIGVRNFQCTECLKTFHTKNYLKKHVDLVHTVEPVVCDICGKVCGNSLKLYTHKQFTHIKEAKFGCSFCPYKTGVKSTLRRHEKTHTGERNYVCQYCNKSYITSGTMTSHINAMHKKLRPIKCDVCGKGFYGKNNLRKHTVVHSGIKPFSCPLCPSSNYSFYVGLSFHVKHNHPDLKIETEKNMWKKFHEENNIIDISSKMLCYK